MENMTSKQMLGDILKRHYAGAIAAKAAGRPVVWSTSIAPQELLEAMDLTVVYPENHAAAIGAGRMPPVSSRTQRVRVILPTSAPMLV